MVKIAVARSRCIAPGSLREVERQQILAALEQTGWHRGKTAEILGISPSTLYGVCAITISKDADTTRIA
jgi:DNA-binding NtrC family response regulator